MTASTELVDSSLDLYVTSMKKRGLDPDGVRVRTLAELAGVTPSKMSSALQEYRATQASACTRYVVASQDYGRNARWKILGKPGSDPLSVQRNRQKQAEWAIMDAAQRFISDHRHELLPGLKGKEMDDAIGHAAKFVENQLTGLIQFVTAMLGSNEQ